MKKTSSQPSSKPNRVRKNSNITLSDTAREMGRELAVSRGIKFSQLVEQLVRAELRNAGVLKSEGTKE